MFSIVYAADEAKISTLYNPARNFPVGINFKVANLLTGIEGSNGIDVLNLVFILIGLYFFTNLVMAGWTLMMSSGDVKKATAAGTQITNAFSGLVMSFTAFLIVKIILTILGINDSLQLQ